MIFKNITIDNISKDILYKCKNYPKKGLYIYGKIGVGKTYLAIAIARHVSKNKFKFVNVKDILREFRMCESALNEFNLMNDYTYKRHLVIDDLGVEKLTDYAYSIIYELIDKRTLYNPEAFIITSNLSPVLLKDKLDTRITSRIMEMCDIIELLGKDRRINKKEE